MTEDLDLKRKLAQLEIEIAALKAASSDLAPELPQDDIIILALIAREGGSFIIERLPNNLQIRAKVLKKRGYLDCSSYSPPICGNSSRMGGTGFTLTSRVGKLWTGRGF